MARAKSAAATPDLDWKLRFGFLVHDVSRLRRKAIDRVLKPLGVTRSQWWVLAFLSRRDGIPQVALAAELDLGKVALGGLIDRLEAAELVERHADPNDRRVKRVFLTKNGLKLIGKMRDASAGAEGDILRGVDDADLKASVRTLRRMKENLLGLLGDEDDEEASEAA